MANPNWTKGVSGNPSGRPKKRLPDGRTIAEAAMEHAELALKTLAEIAGNAGASEAARVSASNALLDRGFGKAAQPVVGDDDEPPVQFVSGTPAEWAAKLKTDTLRDLAENAGE